MIVTDLVHMNHQVPMNPSFRKVFEFLLRPNITALPDGRTEIDGDRVFALVQRYETVATAAPKFEYHRKYIDVQFIASGEEITGWAPAGTMKVSEAYDTDRDICFGTVAHGKWTPVRLEAGQLMVLWPEDAHAPKGAAGGPSKVMKIVIKVAV
jgi:YhcH/YjgK/YiaL family protein